MRPQSQQHANLYCDICGTRLEMVRHNQSINAATVRPCAECAPDAHAQSWARSMEATAQTERLKELKAARTARRKVGVNHVPR